MTSRLPLQSLRTDNVLGNETSFARGVLQQGHAAYHGMEMIKMEFRAIIKHALQPTGRFPFALRNAKELCPRPYATCKPANKSTPNKKENSQERNSLNGRKQTLPVSRRTSTDPDSTNLRRDRHTDQSLPHRLLSLYSCRRSILVAAGRSTCPAEGSSLAEGSLAGDSSPAGRCSSPDCPAGRSSLATGLDSMVETGLGRRQGRCRSGLEQVAKGTKGAGLRVRSVATAR